MPFDPTFGMGFPTLPYPFTFAATYAAVPLFDINQHYPRMPHSIGQPPSGPIARPVMQASHATAPNVWDPSMTTMRPSVTNILPSPSL